MPRKPKQEVVIPTTALVASAVRFDRRKQRLHYPTENWQTECYRHYAICGEARFAARFFGHAMAKARLHAARREDGELVATREGTTAELLDALFNGPQGQEQMLEAIGIHLTVAGECFLVGREVDGEDLWEVVSPLEMKVAGGRWIIQYGKGMEPVELDDDDVVIRIWIPDPAQRVRPDSPFRSLLPVLQEIEQTTKHIFSQISSRLKGAGILFMPQSMTFPPPPAQDGQQQATANDAEAFMLTLAEAMEAAKQDPESPAGSVPITVTAPDDAIDKPRLLTFWSELDSAAQEMRREAIHRFALGMDLPPEQVLGMGSNAGTAGGSSNGVSHWGAWMIEEQTIKMHIEPMLELVANALTIGYIRPLAGEGADGEQVTYDTTALRLRPDRSREAIEMWDRGVLGTETMLEENGFDTADMPEDEEFKRWLLRKIATGVATPEQMQAALKLLGVDLPVASVGDAPGPQLPADRTLDDHPTRRRDPSEDPDYIPRQRRRYRRRRQRTYQGEPVDEAALLAASEALVFRALERAGNRLRNVAKPDGVPAYETHCYVNAYGKNGVLDDAWSCADKVLDGIADPEDIVPVLDGYCQSLFSERAAHDRARLEDWLFPKVELEGVQ